jgi:hypothetical protein
MAWVQACARAALIHKDIARTPMDDQTLGGDMSFTPFQRPRAAGVDRLRAIQRAHASSSTTTAPPHRSPDRDLT